MTTDPIASIIKLDSSQKKKLKSKHETLWEPVTPQVQDKSKIFRREMLSVLSRENQIRAKDSLGKEFFDCKFLTERSISESDPNDFVGLATAELESS